MNNKPVVGGLYRNKSSLQVVRVVRTTDVRVGYTMLAHGESGRQFAINTTRFLKNYIPVTEKVAAEATDITIGSRWRGRRGTVYAGKIHEVIEAHTCVVRHSGGEDRNYLHNFEDFLKLFVRFKVNKVKLEDDEIESINPYEVQVADKPKDDGVNSPQHYNQGGIECVDAIEAQLTREQFIGWLRGTIAKYNWRLGLKDASIKDAAKMQWYINRLKATLEKSV